MRYATMLFAAALLTGCLVVLGGCDVTEPEPEPVEIETPPPPDDAALGRTAFAMLRRMVGDGLAHKDDFPQHYIDISSVRADDVAAMRDALLALLEADR